jgi:hypothetical protein
MTGDTVVVVRAGDVVLAVITSFARLPVPGEHVLLWLNDSQRAQVGAEFGFGHSKLCVPAVVRDTILRQKDQWRKNMPNRWSSAIMEDHVADLFVEAITTADWRVRTARWPSGGDQA